MWQSYTNGLFITAGLIVALGAQNAFVLAQSLRRQHHWAVALFCILCDITLISIGVLGLATALAKSPLLLAIARWGGAAFLLWYGAQALLRALHPQGLRQTEIVQKSLRAVMLSAVAVTLLNPHVYLDTVLLIGSLGAQQAEPVAYAIGASTASAIWFTLLALTGAWLAPWLARPITWRVIDLLVALMMGYIALQLILQAPVVAVA